MIEEEDPPAVLCRDDSTSKEYGVWQNGNAEVGIMDDKTCYLTTGAGKPGQGYPCVLVEEQAESTDNTYPPPVSILALRV